MKFEIIKKSILLGILIILLVIYYGMDNPKVERTYKLKKDNAIAVMVYDETTEDYVSQESIPTGMYQLNKDKTYCVNGGKVNSYNKTLGKLNYTLNTDDKCYVYFDVRYLTLSEAVIEKSYEQEHISSQDESVYSVQNNSFLGSGEFSYLTESEYGNYTGDITLEYQSDQTMKILTSQGHNLNIPLPTDAYYELCVDFRATSSTEDRVYATFPGGSFVYHKRLGLRCSKFYGTAGELVEFTMTYPVRMEGYISLKKATSGSLANFVYRYSGKNPDNYVYYNDELWRIIGVFDGSDISLESGKMYPKLVRNSVFNKKYFWGFIDPDGSGKPNGDETYTTDWDYSPLNTLLNNDYHNSTGDFISSAIDKGLNNLSRNMIAKYNNNYSTWYASTISIRYNNLSARVIYEQEIGLNLAGSSLKAILPIGLISASDYGYAFYDGVENSACNPAALTFAEDEGVSSTCAIYNWLNLSSRYYILNVGDYIYEIDTNGNFTPTYFTSASAIRPALYLSSEVKVVGGNGSADSPYQISL